MNIYAPGIKGCSDHNCIFQDNAKGMHTNGGCRCEKALLRTAEGIKAARTIRYLRMQMEMKNKVAHE